MLLINRIILIIILSLPGGLTHAQIQNDQKRDYCWIFAWGHAPFPLGATSINFNIDPVEVSAINQVINTYYTNSSICDTNGDLIIHTNGMYVSDRNQQLMPNGDSINPGDVYNNLTQEQTGYIIPGGATILPCPDDNQKYYIIHQKMVLDSVIGLRVSGLYYSVVDMTLNNGDGDLQVKNVEILSETLNCGIGVVRHGNGRDWWIVVAGFPVSSYHKFLLTPNGIINYGVQYLGSSYSHLTNGKLLFSQEGDRMAYGGNTYYPNGWNRLEVFNFDRCAGMISNLIDLSYSSIDTTLQFCPEFSPNNRFLYVTTNNNIYQYDLNSANINGSRQTVAIYDGFIDPIFNFFPTYFSYTQLAPNGKIYITAGGNTHYLHTIDFPDSLGQACYVAQHSIELTALQGESMPFFPNFRLGPILGSICDTITSSELLPDFNAFAHLDLFPNPTTGLITIQIKSNDLVVPDRIEIKNIFGNLVKKIPISSYQSYFSLDLGFLPSGIYIAVLIDKKGQTYYKKFQVLRK